MWLEGRFDDLVDAFLGFHAHARSGGRKIEGPWSGGFLVSRSGLADLEGGDLLVGVPLSPIYPLTALLVAAAALGGGVLMVDSLTTVLITTLAWAFTITSAGRARATRRSATRVAAIRRGRERLNARAQRERCRGWFNSRCKWKR